MRAVIEGRVGGKEQQNGGLGQRLLVGSWMAIMQMDEMVFIKVNGGKRHELSGPWLVVLVGGW